MGWYGFNAGSALQSGYLAASTVASTTVAASSSCVVFIILSTIHHPRKNSVRTLDVINGVIAGLAGITPASGFVRPYAAAIIGMFRIYIFNFICCLFV